MKTLEEFEKFIINETKKKQEKKDLKNIIFLWTI